MTQPRRVSLWFCPCCLAYTDDRRYAVMANASTVGKEILRQNTDKAFGDGAFGVPWFLASNSSGVTEGFWGVDHIGQVLLFLGIEKAAHGGWNSVL